MACDVFLSYTSVKDTLYGAVSKFRKHLEHELRKKTGNVNLTVAPVPESDGPMRSLNVLLFICVCPG